MNKDLKFLQVGSAPSHGGRKNIVHWVTKDQATLFGSNPSYPALKLHLGSRELAFKLSKEVVSVLLVKVTRTVEIVHE